MRKAVISVTGKDQPGIIAHVTGILYKQGANLEDISMTILEGEFAMMMIANAKTKKAEGKIREGFERLQKKSGLNLTWKELKREPVKGKKHRRDSETYILSAAGKDRTGIVYEISNFFARKELNITDLNSKILPQRRGELYVLMLEVDIPRKYALRKIETGLQRLQKKLNIDIQFKPIETLNL